MKGPCVSRMVVVLCFLLCISNCGQSQVGREISLSEMKNKVHEGMTGQIVRVFPEKSVFKKLSVREYQDKVCAPWLAHENKHIDEPLESKTI